MTTITTDQLIPTTQSTRSLRHAVGGFVAGAVLASAAFLGVNAVRDDSSSSSPVPAVQHVNPPSPTGCPVTHGAC